MHVGTYDRDNYYLTRSGVDTGTSLPNSGTTSLNMSGYEEC